MTFHSKWSSKHGFFVLFTLATALFPLHTAQGAVVTLDNGDRISGEILELDGDTLRFKSGVFGEIAIPWLQVVHLESDDGLRMRLADGREIEGKLLLEQDRLSVAPRHARRQSTLGRESLIALNPPPAPDDVSYSGQLDVGGSLNSGNTRDKQFNLIGSLDAQAASYRYNLGVELNEARAGGETTTSYQRLRGQYDAVLSPSDYVFFSAKAERDELADLNLRATLGAGYGRLFINSPAIRLAGQTGLSYVHENYRSSPDPSFPGLTLGLKYDHKFLGGRLAYFQHHDLDISLRNARDALLRTRLGLRVPVAHGISVSTQLNLDYNNRPAPGNEKLDTSLIFSVGYAF